MLKGLGSWVRCLDLIRRQQGLAVGVAWPSWGGLGVKVGGREYGYDWDLGVGFVHGSDGDDKSTTNNHLNTN